MANNIAVLDGAGASQTVKTTDNAGVHTPHHNVDSSALPTGASTLAEQQTQTTALGAHTTALQIMDDWDESDRAKVNPIVGQAGVAAGAGAVGATVPRVTLASDDPAVTDLAALEVLITGIDADTDAIKTATQLIDDAIFTDDAAYTIGTSKVMMIGAVVDDDSTDDADEGDAVVVRATPQRKLRTIAALDSAFMQSGNDQVTPKFAIIDAASSGDNTLVSAVASKKIRVLSLYLVAAGTVTVRFEDGASGTAKSGQMNLVANTGFVLPFNPIGWFETTANTLLNLELSAAISVDGGLTYIEVD